MCSSTINSLFLETHRNSIVRYITYLPAIVHLLHILIKLNEIILERNNNAICEQKRLRSEASFGKSKNNLAFHLLIEDRLYVQQSSAAAVGE